MKMINELDKKPSQTHKPETNRKVLAYIYLLVAIPVYIGENSINHPGFKVALG